MVCKRGVSLYPKSNNMELGDFFNPIKINRLDSMTIQPETKKTNTMTKGILIDVNNKTITEVTVEKSSDGSQLDSMYKLLGCEMVEVVSLGENDIYVDEEGLLKVTPSSKFFMYEGYPQPLAGNGIILGFDDNTGDNTDTTLTVEEVKQKVKFLNYGQVRMNQY